MPSVRLAAASLNQTPLDWEGNVARAVAATDAARDAGARLFCLPELALSGYGCEDAFYAPHVAERAAESLAAFAESTAGIAALIGLPLRLGPLLYNAAAMVVDRRVVGVALKQHLAGDGLHYEPRWFTAWPADLTAAVALPTASPKPDDETPIGDLVFDFDGIGVGVEVCRDAWVGDNRPAYRHARRGVSVVLNPSASHFAFGKQATRERLVREGAAIVEGAYVYANLLGNESGRSVYDGGALFAVADAASDGAGETSQGRLVATGRRFGYGDHELTVVDVEAEPREPPTGATRVTTGWSLAAPPQPVPAEAVGRVTPRMTKHEEFGRAVPLGLRDYRRKCGARGFVVSLSGGADSAACAVMAWLANRFAELEGAADADVPLTTVYQATRNSSDTTRDAASAVAAAVGATHHAWSVDAMVAAYTDVASQALGRELAWETDDVALQNIQSRARVPGVWMLANVLGGLLLTTGNRSEASVGYATMDGDTSGGLAPIAGIDKAYLLEWLRWMETDGPAGVGPLPALAAVNAQQPTAELRPPASGQTDEADLMPYAVLDVIERSAIARLEPPETTVRRVVEAFPEALQDQGEERAREWVARFWSLWRTSQWKRERLAPAFHLDTHSVDPKTFRRWPILSAAIKLDDGTARE